jgi:sugar phosphate isomerase/epimerase
MNRSVYRIGTTSDLYLDHNGTLPPGMTEADSIRLLAQVGFEALDYGVFWHQNQNGKYWGEDWLDYAKSLKEAAESAQIDFSQLHAPMFSLLGKDAQEQLTLTKRSFYIAQALGAPYLVVHPQFLPDCLYDNRHDEMLSYNLEFYQSLLEDSAKTGVKIALENMFSYDPKIDRLCQTYFSLPEDLLELLDHTEGREQFVICLDVGHANIIGKDTPADYIRKFDKDLKLLHLHDNFGKSDDHMPPYYGTIDWDDTIHALREVGYTGVLSLEAQMLARAIPNTNFPMRQKAIELTYEIARSLAKKG